MLLLFFNLQPTFETVEYGQSDMLEAAWLAVTIRMPRTGTKNEERVVGKRGKEKNAVRPFEFKNANKDQRRVTNNGQT